MECLGVPAAPGKPVVQEVSNTSVMVHWDPPPSSTTATVSYTLDYRQEGECVCVWLGEGGEVELE